MKNTTIKGFLIFILFISLSPPLFAAWWNPTTWFKSKNSTAQKVQPVVNNDTKNETQSEIKEIATTTVSKELPKSLTPITVTPPAKEEVISSTTSCVTLTTDLLSGSENNDVLILQGFLVSKGYLNAKPNGYFGVGTVNAIKKFQGASGLPQNGKAELMVRKKIQEISCADTNIKKPVTSQPLPVSEVSTTTKVAPTVSEDSTGGFIETAKGYDYFNNITGVNGKLAYIASKKIADSGIPGPTVVVYDGKEISTQYTFVNGLVKIGNKLAYYASTKNRGKVIVYDGVEVFPEQCRYVDVPKNINGKLAFNCTKKSDGDRSDNYAGPAVMFLDGVEVPLDKKRYFLDSHYAPFDVDGKLAYHVLDRKDLYDVHDTILLDGVDLASTKKYIISSQLYSVNGKFVFLTQKKPEDPYTLVYDGVEISKKYNYIDSVAAVDGKSYVVVRASDGRVTTTAMFVDGVIKDTGYDAVYGVVEVNGKLAYLAKKGSKSYVVYDGKELGKEYDEVGPPANVNSKLAFPATKNGKSFIVIEK